MVTPYSVAPTDRRRVVSLFSRLRKPGGQESPLPIYAELQAMGDVVPAPWGGHLVTSFGLSDQVLRNRAWRVTDNEWAARQGQGTRWSAASSREIGQTLVRLNPPHHTLMRRSVGNMFDRSALADIKKSVERTTDRLVARLAERLRDGVADFVPLVSEELPVITIGEWMGLPAADFPLLRALTHDQVFTQELLPSPSQLMISDNATRTLHEYFSALVRDRRRSPGDDPVSQWLRIWDELEPDRDRADEAVYYLALLVVLAALETTSTLLSTMAWLIAGHPRQMGWLRAHPQDIPGAVEEVLRYDPPIHVVTRVAGDDMRLADIDVRKDETVHLMLAAANHDPAQYADPHIFDIRRKVSHLSFGGGIHYCVGAPLARMEAAALLTSLLRRLPGLRLHRPPEWAPRVAFRRLTTLQVADTAHERVPHQAGPRD
ncbi:Cytochrome P450 [Actinacidiphila alni]|uniref:Cytochrome P450 n=1 Tax=Actinacidiphila alni TaxID=380248 RepID=A0A1I2IP34_9ACTN|nr:Cytochrome P450 [Actinacidiphila alni]